MGNTLAYETRVESTPCFQPKRVSALKELEIPMISSSVKALLERQPFYGTFAGDFSRHLLLNWWVFGTFSGKFPAFVAVLAVFWNICRSFFSGKCSKTTKAGIKKDGGPWTLRHAYRRSQELSK